MYRRNDHLHGAADNLEMSQGQMLNIIKTGCYDPRCVVNKGDWL